MILYSIIPSEIVFADLSDEKSNTYFREISYMGERVEVSPLTNNRMVIQRIISTNPAAYLNPKLQPGTIIEARV